MAEPTPYMFRTSLVGFHKLDVSNYITRYSAEQQTQIQQLESYIFELEAEVAHLKTQVHPENEPSLADINTEQSIEEKELDAYRRAEMVERQALQRAKAIYTQVQAICDRATAELAAANATAYASATVIAKELENIRTASQTLCDTINQINTELSAVTVPIADLLQA